MVTSHDVIAHVGDFEHFSQFLHVSSEHVQEGKAVEVFLALVAHFHNLKIRGVICISSNINCTLKIEVCLIKASISYLMITLTQGFTSKLTPNIT